jgi:hypothetical protein
MILWRLHCIGGFSASRKNFGWLFGYEITAAAARRRRLRGLGPMDASRLEYVFVASSIKPIMLIIGVYVIILQLI